jgi:hypothetical protein
MIEASITFNQFHILVKLNMGFRVYENTIDGKPKWEHPFKKLDRWDRRIMKGTWKAVHSRGLVKLMHAQPLYVLSESGLLAMNEAMTRNPEWREYADWLNKEYAS